MAVRLVPLVPLLVFCWVSAAEDQVPPPENVRIVSWDMGLVLEWDPPQNSAGKNFTYTAQYRGWQNFESVCLNTPDRRCEFTRELTLYGTYAFRVWTELDGKNSSWVQTDEVALDHITLISAPGVTLESAKGGIDVDITDPVMRRSSLKDVYRLSYRIRYWMEGEEKKEELKTEQSRVTLQKLTPRVRYCVQVEIAVDFNKTSLPSNTTCILNTESEDVPPWLIVLVLLVSFAVALISVVLIFFAGWYIYRGVRFLQPQAHLPEDLKEYLSERPKSSLDIQNNLQPEEHYHEVSIIPCVEAPVASQDSGRTPPYANASVRAAEDLKQKETLCDPEQGTDSETSVRDAAPSCCQDGETALLL